MLEERREHPQPAASTSSEKTSLQAGKRQPLKPPSSWLNVARQTAPTTSSPKTALSHSQTSSVQHQTSSATSLAQHQTSSPTSLAERQTSSATSHRRRLSEESSQVIRKKIKYEHRQSQIAFISDSMFKFMVEDNVSSNFILHHNLESNISLHRGLKSAELYEKSLPSLNSYLASGVNKVILCCGTNDIANLPFTCHNVTEIAQHVADVVGKFNTLCKSNKASLLYVTPTPNSYVSDTGFHEFSDKLNSLLTSNQIQFIQPFEILKTSTDNSCEDVIHNNSTDQLHWTFEAGRRILKASLSHFGIGCSMDTSTSQSPLYTALQKHQISLCFKCGSSRHSKRDCTKSHLHCSHCGSRSHVDSVCGYKYLPCTHCGTVGHYVGNRTQCLNQFKNLPLELYTAHRKSTPKVFQLRKLRTTTIPTKISATSNMRYSILKTIVHHSVFAV